MTQPAYLTVKNGGKIAYCKGQGSEPGIIFLGGFRSDMTGSKAMALDGLCRERGIGFVRFDYRGHGQSSKKFEECTLSMWREDALAVLEKLSKGPQIIVGSSMGGWLALLLAIAKPRRVAGIIGIAAAPDFTEALMLPRLSAEQQKELKQKGRVSMLSEFSGPYTLSQEFFADARKHLLLHHKELPIYCPVRLLHGMKDVDVPWETSLSINEKMAGQDVKTILIDEGDHRLSEPQDIEKLLRVTDKLLNIIVNDKKPVARKEAAH